MSHPRPRSRSCPVGLLASLLLWSLLAPVLAAGLDASLDRTRLAEGESVLLTLTGPGDVWGTPDITHLSRDFTVQNQGQGTSTVMTNGRVTTTREWRFLLTPKGSGTLTVPAFKLGDLESLPIAIEVVPAAQAAQLGEAPAARLEAELDRDAVYVQGQAVYTLRILLRPQVQNPSLDDPKAEGVQFERLGEDRVTEVNRDGQRYRLIERRYALLPQHSGRVEIQSPVLSATVPESRASRGRNGGSPSPFGEGDSPFERLFGRDPFAEMEGLFQRTRPIQVRGPVLSLTVEPQPRDAPTPWLPADDLQLVESWTPDPDQAESRGRIRVGEPLTRTLAITALGLSANQLPDLSLAVPAGIQVYPDKPRAETRAEGDRLVAVKEMKFALVPSQAGRLTLPEVRLAWWDTRTDQARVAVLPERVLEVLPASDGTTTASPLVPDTAAPASAGARTPSSPAMPGAGQSPPGASPAQPNPSAGQVPAGDGSPVAFGSPPPSGAPGSALSPPSSRIEPGTAWPLPAGYWPWLAAGLGLAWLASLWLWWRERRRHPAPAGGKPYPGVSVGPRLAAAREGVRQACAGGEPRQVRDALLVWARARWPTEPPRRLEDLATRLAHATGKAEADKGTEWLRCLDRSLYADTGARWDGPAAWRELSPLLDGAQPEARPGHARSTDPLPPLYPSP